MPTAAQLAQEAEWRDQFVPPELADLVRNLDAYYDSGTINIGAFGDHRHLKGYHRSRSWIRNSKYCTNRSYSVSETTGNRAGGNDNWISAIDIVVGQARSQVIWARINYARQHGRLSYLREVLLERDPWHVHLSIERQHANDNHSLLFAIITGQDDPREGRVSFNVDMPELRKGAEGADVVTAQALLGARGFETAVDGDFGPHTDEQTRAMQTRYGAEAVDGIWGPETWTIAMTGEDRL